MRRIGTKGAIAALGATLVVASSAWAVTIIGTDGDDQITGSPGNDRIDARAGNDTVVGLAGNDGIRGGRGDDRISGGPGDDVLRGDSGEDGLGGGEGNDRILARDGEADKILCGPGRDAAVIDTLDVIVDATRKRPKGSCERVARRHVRPVQTPIAD